MSINTITHHGKKILFIDYSGRKKKEDSLALLNETADFLRGHPDGSVLLLSDLTAAFTGPDFMKRSKELGSIFKSKPSKAALIGITGLKKILLRAYNSATGDNMIPFDTKEEALAWLVK